jgi:hypothetical protein
MINVIKWLGTLLTAGGALMTAIDVDPLNIYLFNGGAFFWLVASIRMRDFPLICLNASLLIISIVGLILRIDTN